MKTLPANVEVYQTTPEFTETTLPPGFDGNHSTKEGVWARVRVLEGSMLYRILEPETEEYLLAPGSDGIVEPQVSHQFEMNEPVRFLIEFLK